MSCFFCFSLETRAPKNNYPKTVQPPAPAQRVAADESFELRLRPANRTPSAQNAVQSSVPEASNGKVSNANGNGNIAAQTFTFRQLASATKNFRSENLLGGGGFGRVYKGQLENGQSVAVKQLDRTGLQGNNEFLVEVMMLSLLHHENLVNLVGYCADGDQRLLVYEYMPLGSLEDHLFVLTPDQKPLSWRTRMKIASDAARGLEYLHGANPPVIFRDLKPSNILLDEEYAGKLSDFGLAKLGSAGEYKLQPVSSRVMGTYGYCAPEYARTGQLTMRSDVYSFGVVLLELISGRSAIDTARPADEENLVAWARPMFKDQRRFRELVDPLLQEYPEKSLNQAVAVAAMCLEEDDAVRPLMTDIVGALTPLAIESTAVEGSSSHKLSSSPVQPENGEPDDQSKQRPSNAAADRQRAVAEAIKWGSNLLVSAQIQARSNSSREDHLE